MKKTVTIALYVVRLGGVAALVLGLSIRLGLNIPLHVHMGVGGLTLLAFLTLAIAARKCSPILLALAAILLVPLFGLAQTVPALAGLSPLSEWVHPALAIAALALAERTARAARSA
jgi:hypothetical protein